MHAIPRTVAVHSTFHRSTPDRRRTPRPVAPDSKNVTQLLIDLRSGHREAFDLLLPHVYDELRRVARHQLRKERPGHTLDTAGLVHEAYAKLIDYRALDWQSRAHFFAVAAQAMRRILVSYARRKKAEKRGGGAVRVTLDESAGAITWSENWADEMAALDAALERLEALNPRHARIIECRFFANLSIKETAEALGISSMTVTRDWRMARAWLQDALRDKPN